MTAFEINLKNQIFDAFSWRERPNSLWDLDDLERRGVEEKLSGLTARQVTFTVMESDCRDQVFLSTADRFIYYLPSVVALCIDDMRRANLWPDIVLWKFRVWPVMSKTLDWSDELQQSKDFTERNRANLRKWFYCAGLFENRFTPKHNLEAPGFLNEMTKSEREAIALYFDYYEGHPDRLGSAEYIGTEIDYEMIVLRAAKAMLRGEMLGARLGAENMDDRRLLLESLDILEHRLPDDFPPEETRPIERALLAEQE